MTTFKFPVNTPKDVVTVNKPVVFLPGLYGSILGGGSAKPSAPIRRAAEIYQAAPPGAAFNQNLAKLQSQTSSDSVWGADALIDAESPLMTEKQSTKLVNGAAAAIEQWPSYDALIDFLREAYVVQFAYQDGGGSFEDDRIESRTPRDVPDAFVLAYDWRQGCDKAAGQVASYVNRMHGKLPTKHKEHKFTIVAHGMGGIVARLALEGGQISSGVCDQLITLGTPHRGTVDAIATLLGFLDPLRKPMLVDPFERREQGALAREWDSIYQLLPTDDVVTHDGVEHMSFETYLKQKDQTGERDLDVHHFLTKEATEKLIDGLKRNKSILGKRDNGSAPGGVRYHYLGSSTMPTRQRFRPMGDFHRELSHLQEVGYSEDYAKAAVELYRTRLALSWSFLERHLFDVNGPGDGHVPSWSAGDTTPSYNEDGSAADDLAEGTEYHDTHHALGRNRKLVERVEYLIGIRYPDPIEFQ